MRFPGVAGGFVECDGDGGLGDRVLGDRTDGEAAGAGCGPDVPHAASATMETNTQGRQRSTRSALRLPIREMRARCVTKRDYRPQSIWHGKWPLTGDGAAALVELAGAPR